jgi:hypothetical protein
LKNNKAEDMAMDIAWYMMSGKPVPGHLYDNLMAEVYADYKKERERDKLSNSPKVVEAV